jgi:formylglycine-generating enzyme
MRYRFVMKIQAVFWLLCLALASGAGAAPFTYQGRLLQNGVPANGPHDLRFELFRSASGSGAIAGALTKTDVTVADGVFTTILDFGANVSFGGGCWLEIGVRASGWDDDFTILSPRQPITPGPFTGEVTLSARQIQRLWRVSIPFVAITNAGNDADFTGKGAVAYNFRIGKYEINNNQYVAFLNAVAADDPKRLYSLQMDDDIHGGILRSGSPGEHSYTVKPGYGHKPVVFVDFYDVLRFCNWLHNGQPSGPQDDTTTEDGAYTLSPAALAAENVLRNPNARFWLPSDDEWYKAAYHQPANMGGDPSDYWFFPNRSNDVPISEPPPGGINSANACCETEHKAYHVGAYTQSVSFYGTYDQAGNVQEWTEWTSDFAYSLRNRRVRGGSWVYNEFYSRSTDFEFDTTDYDAEAIGFRVAGAAE